MKKGKFKLNILFKNTLLFTLVYLSLTSAYSQNIIPGSERTNLYIDKLLDKKVAVIANNTSIIRSNNLDIHLIDTLIKRGVKIEKIFSPEHGFLGDKDDGEKIENGFYKSIEVISLYGKNRKINDNDIENIDILIFDIQDVGVRFYTYLSTLHYAMESVSRTNKKLIILDRPNPNSFYIDGPVLDLKNKSFIGLHPVPIVYGMTIGEYGKMINGEGWLENSLKANLEVIKIKNYNHKLKYEPNIRPSPNLPNIQSIYLYPSLAFLEKTEVSVGRGTKTQFQIYGHPDFNEKFLYFPLASEPEARIMVTSPFYTNQIALIENIAKSIPIDYTLYVKEHPVQEVKFWRPVTDYKKLINIPNVKFVHPSVSNHELLPKCQGVIAISGGTSFEAIFYKKPVILFADEYYDVLSMVTRIKTFKTLSNDITDALSNFKFDNNELDAFMQASDNHSLSVPYHQIRDDAEILSSIQNYTDNFNVIAKEFDKFYEAYANYFELMAQTIRSKL